MNSQSAIRNIRLRARLLLTCGIVVGAILAVPATGADGPSSPAAGEGTGFGGPPPPPSPPPSPPVNTVRPVLSGTAREGETVTTTTGTWTGTTPMAFAFMWRRCDSNDSNCATIPGATDRTYRFTAADVRSKIYSSVTATNAAGSASQRSWLSALVIMLTPPAPPPPSPPPPSPPPPSPPPPSPPPPSPPPPSPPPPSPPPPSPPPPSPPPPSPPPPSPPPPPPSGGVNCLVSNRTSWNLRGTNCAFGTELRFQNQQFRCDRPLSEYGRLPLRLVWNFTGNPDWGDQGHLDFLAGCRGDGNSDTIDVIVQTNANGVTLGAAGGAGKFRTAGPTDIQITGNFDCGPLGGSSAHQDAWQFHPTHTPARLDIVNGTSGNWDAGTATCVGAGGAIFWSNDYDVDIYGGRYVSCNHGLDGTFRTRTGNVVVGAGFRTGRNDGSDAKCTPWNASPPCAGTRTLRLENVICQRWDRNSRSWVNVAPTQ